jgi:hypothetical protein
MTLVETRPGAEQDKSNEQAKAIKEMVWLLPDSETPVSVRSPQKNTIDLRTPSTPLQVPQTPGELRSDLGAKYTSLDSPLPSLGPEYHTVTSKEYSAPVPRGEAAGPVQPESVPRDEQAKEARGRLKGLFKRGKSQEPDELDPAEQARLDEEAARQPGRESFEQDLKDFVEKRQAEAQEQADADQVRVSASQTRGRELYRAVGEREDAKQERGKALIDEQIERGRVALDTEWSEVKEQQERGKTAIEAQLQRGKEALDGPISPELSDLSERVRKDFAEARTMDELREKAWAMVGPDGYLAVRSGNKRFQTVDKEFKAAEPSDPNKPRLPGKLVMKELEDAVLNIQQRGNIRRYNDRNSLLRERNEKILSERKEQEEAKQAVEIAKFEAKLTDVPSFTDFVKAKQAEARKPFEKQIKRLKEVELPKLEARKAKRLAMSGDWVDAIGGMDEQIKSANERITELQKMAQQAEIDAEAAANDERAAISEKAIKKSDKALDLVEGDKPGRVNFSPKSGQDADKSLVIADRIGQEVGKKVEANGLPFQVNEYKLNGATMQRLVYKTDHADTVIVEEWNKDTGSLKSQTVLKDKNVLVTNSENDGISRVRAAARRRNGGERQVLNDKLYGEDEKLVKAAASWSEGGGDSGSYSTDDAVRYASRLDRSGISGRGKYEMASDKYKGKNSKGTKSFIKMLQEGLSSGGKK